MELVIAAIGLSIGVLTDASYAIIVLIAVLTTVMAAPLLPTIFDRQATSTASTVKTRALPRSVVRSTLIPV